MSWSGSPTTGGAGTESAVARGPGFVQRVVQASGFWRVAFWLYALALFTATHWPNLKIETAAIERPDLFLHMTVFGVWFVMLLLSGYVGVPTSRVAIVICAIIAAAYAAVDEGSQAIPWVHRQAAWDDLGANLSGIAGALIVALVVASVIAARNRSNRALSSDVPGTSDCSITNR